ncbi:MAG: helix-turn-helix domain-containing protein [Burkholderiales bacterium]|nr:helix-turn-helix domain-containing protein [Bacteroidia bacterium]
MELKIIKTKKDYHKSLARFAEIFSAKHGSKESNEADILALLIKDYENKHFVIDAPTPIEAIKYRMEQQGLSNQDLAKILGYKSRVSDIFHNTRKLNLKMIRKLYETLHIPLETLVKEY